MLRQEQLHDYQKRAVNHQCTHSASALWLDPGLGKTATTLTSVVHLLNSGFLSGVLVIAPIRVVRMVWKQEALKWEHTNHLTFSSVTGSKDQRTRALLRKADVYLINYENLMWLSEVLHTYFIKKNKPLPFNGVVFDEISKMKNSTTRRVKAFMKVHPYLNWTTGLTGTPASNGYKDLHGQFLVLDGGQRLGKSKTAFKERFYYKAGPYREVAYDDTESTIQQLIGDITLEMSAAEYLQLPEFTVNDVVIELPKEVRAKYDQLERDFFFQLDNGTEVEVFNKASLMNKLIQFGNGAVYPIPGMPLWEKVHDAKLDALEDLLEELAGQPLLLAYNYRSDAERIMEKFKGLRPINLTDCKTDQALSNAMFRWNSGDLPLMIAHPACVHPRTEVLTEFRGWVKIVDVYPNERVHDGVEFVNHKGCFYSGFKTVITKFGITMTPDHRILINNEWVRAEHVKDTEDNRKEALFQWENGVDCFSGMSTLWDTTRNDATERNEAQSKGINSLSTLHKGNIPLYDKHPLLENMAWNEGSYFQQRRDRLHPLWGSRNYHVRGMVGFFQVLRGHVQRIRRLFDNRTNRCEQRLLQRELPMGNQHGATSKQKKQSTCPISRGNNTPCRTDASFRIQQNDALNEIEQRDDRRSSSRELQEFTIREEEKAHVYDLVDCGPRSRFLIRNDDGDVFISHNSAGHGIDGLQKNCNNLVWYGMNWSLELYDQFNARINRQGQEKPVICHRILAHDTMDQAQAIALEGKATSQSDLRKAIDAYRSGKK